MEPKQINSLWGVSLFIIGIMTIIFAGSNIIGIKLPDIITRILGVMDCIALVVFIFFTVKKMKNKV